MKTSSFAVVCALASGAALAAVPEFDVHVTVMTEKLQGPSGNKGADGMQRRSEKIRERWQSHVERLNEEFRAESGEPLARFRLHSLTLHSEAKDAKCEALELAARGESFTQAVLKCDDAKIRQPGAVNIYVYAPRSADGETQHFTSRGGHNNKGPFALIHWKMSHDFNTVWHELGHAFGLPHVCSSPRPAGAHWNIMATPDTCKSAKEIVVGFHFDDKQTRTVKAHAEKYRQMFGGR